MMPTFSNKLIGNRKQWLVYGVAALTFIAGLLAVVRPLAERLPDRLTDFLQPIDASGVHASLFTALGLMLIYLSYELSRRKQAAWWATIILSVANLALHSTVERAWNQVGFASLIIVLLAASRPLFNSKLHTENLQQGLRTLIASIGVALIYGTSGFYLLDRHDLGVSFSLGQSFVRTIRAYLLVGNADLTPHTRYGRWFLHSLAIVGSLTLAYGLFSIFRPLRNRLSVLPGERERARQLLERYGGETDDFFKLWPTDKSYFFSSDGQAFVAYGVANGIALCFAGPVGDRQSIPLLMREFNNFCLENGLSVAFAQTTDRFDTQLKKAGCSRLLIGADAVIDLEQFLTDTVRNKYFRNIMNRFAKAGLTTHYYTAPHSHELISEIRQVSDEWQGGGRRRQWRFFTGYFAERYLQQTAIFAVRNEHGHMIAFVNELPSFKAGEATIDLMRHRQDIPSNAMDFLFVEYFKQLRERGYKHFNLGLSPLAGKDFAKTPGDKFINFVYNANQRLISFKGLHRYKDKFEPRWEPRYLYWQGGPARLAQIGLAVATLIRY